MKTTDIRFNTATVVYDPTSGRLPSNKTLLKKEVRVKTTAGLALNNIFFELRVAINSYFYTNYQFEIPIKSLYFFFYVNFADTLIIGAIIRKFRLEIEHK